jgi:hypothetical protein
MQYNERVHQLFTAIEVYVLVRREVLYNILNDFGIPVMCLNNANSKGCIGKNLYNAFLFRLV